jgi:cytochrome c oxidase accessory protein FixG
MNDSIERASNLATEIKVGSGGSLYEKHETIHVRSVKGWWTTWRWVFVWGTQILFYALPWVQWGDRQAVLFHLVERKFYLFGLILWPQDVFYLTVLLIVSAYALFLFTAVAGRLFCGYACPQTVYSEIFMWIEKALEGERPARIKLDKASMDGRKFRVKATKHLLWLLISLWTGFTLVGYFTPMHELVASVPTFGFGGWEILWICLYGGFTYLMAGFMREQVCKYMCPYARFQSVMFDPDTLIITYDPERGEPRGAFRKGRDRSQQGDCVDCNICVQVCPTGIDIRKGLQYECIGCGACIDGCDEVMARLNMPRGLVRYTSENVLKGKSGRTGFWSHVIRPRILVYSGLLALILAAASWSLATRVPLRADVIRDRFSLAREVKGGKIENVYTLKVMNISERARTFTIGVSGQEGLELVEDPHIEAGAAANSEVTVSVHMPAGALPQGSHKIVFDIVAVDDPKVAVHEKSTFLMP